MTHWTERYIGTPWVAGESDCWHLARRVWAERFGVAVPVIEADAQSALAGRRAFAGDRERARWLDVEVPLEGDAVLMGKRSDRPCHVGIWVAPGMILHSVEGAGVILTRRARLSDIGYRVVGYFRRSACALSA